MHDDTREPGQEGHGEQEEPSDWLKEHVEREKQERARRLRTEVRGTRLRRDEANELDRRAAAAGVDVSTFIRLMCLGERPDVEGLSSALRQVCRLVRAFETACQDEPPTIDQVQALREAVEQVCQGLT